MPDCAAEPFVDKSDPQVRGFLHRPDKAANAIVLTHGAGGNSRMAMLVAVADAFCSAGFAVLRCDLPFRQARPFGPPRPNEATHDRAGLKNAVAAIRKLFPGRIFLGGQSYGGRQASMLAAEQPELVDGLLLFSYPLHPPGKPDQPRTQHLPQTRVPALFVSGTHDPFGTIEELRSAIKLISAKTVLLPMDHVGHDLGFRGKKKNEALPQVVLAEFQKLFA